MTRKSLRIDSFDALLKLEVEKMLPDLQTDQIGTDASLLTAYQGQRYMPGILHKIIGNRERHKERHFWRRGKKATAPSLEYYQRIVALGKAHNVKVGFYFLPNIMTPKPTQEELESIVRALGAPVYTLPYNYTRVSYHHYKDPAHVTPAFRAVYSTWFASLIDRIEDD